MPAVTVIDMCSLSAVTMWPLGMALDAGKLNSLFVNSSKKENLYLVTSLIGKNHEQMLPIFIFLAG